MLLNNQLKTKKIIPYPANRFSTKIIHLSVMRTAIDGTRESLESTREPIMRMMENVKYYGK
jgi:hypothetical protein